MNIDADTDTDEEMEETEQPRKATRSPAPPRISVTVTPELRKKIRIASARADLEIGEWCKLIVAEASKRVVKKLYPDED